jgi:thioester reductase-like protein
VEAVVCASVDGEIPGPSDQQTVPVEVIYGDGSTEIVDFPYTTICEVQRVEPVELDDLTVWKTEVDNLFSLPEAKVKEPTKTTRVTSHRLLTSDEIISQKREDMLKKRKAEEEKEERKKKKEANKIKKMESKSVKPKKAKGTKSKPKPKPVLSID